MSAKIRKGSKCHSFMGQEMTCLPDTFTDIEEDFEIQILPRNSLLDSDDIPLEFPIAGTSDQYIHLGDTYIHIRVRLVKKNGTKITSAIIVTPVNLFVHALFGQIDVYINEVLVTKNSGNYPFRAYIGTTCAYSDVAKDSWLQNEMWFEDKYGDAFDDVKVDKSTNGGLVVRNELAAESRTMDMVFKPHVDMFMQNRPIPPSTDVRLTLVRTAPKFSLMTESTEELKIEIVYACMHVRVLKLSHSVTLNHKESLLHNNHMKYPIKRVTMRSFTLPPNVLSYTRQNMLRGQLPIFIILGMTTNAAYSGSFTKSPFRFRPFNLKKINLVVGGRTVPSRPYSFNFDTEGKAGLEYARSMRSLCGLLKPKYGDVGNSISRKMYEDGFTLIPFVIQPDYDSSSLSLIKEGTVDLEMEFGKVNSDVINVVLFIEYENTVMIGKDGDVTIDY